MSSISAKTKGTHLHHEADRQVGGAARVAAVQLERHERGQGRDLSAKREKERKAMLWGGSRIKEAGRARGIFLPISRCRAATVGTCWSAEGGCYPVPLAMRVHLGMPIQATR